MSRPPTALTSFVGRQRELAEVKQRMAESRLVTLTGPGGVGKTRVVLEVAERRVADSATVCVIVELGSLEDDSSLSHVVASALPACQVVLNAQGGSRANR